MTDDSAFEIAAGYLFENAETLVDSWIDWLRERVNTTPISSLPERGLRNHIPPVLRSLSDYIRNPIELTRSELLGHLRLHGQIRRDQGYSLEEVLAEFDGLADMVTRGVVRELQRWSDDRQPGEPAVLDEVLTTVTRLERGLRSVSYIAMGTFSRTESERAIALSTNLEDFARAIAHELRNPLNTMSLAVEFFRQTLEGDDRADRTLAAMEGSIRQSKSVIDTVRTLAVAESARAGRRLVTLGEAVTAITRELAENADEGDVEIIVDRPLPETSVESVLLYIVLVNVVGNALKYADPDKQERWVKLSAKLIPEEYDSGFCEIRVEDNGIGIPEEFVPRIFQKGFRAHPERAYGTGLGLYLVERSVAERGGTVSLSSKEGEGTTVTIRVRSLNPDTDALTADRFSVEHLMGDSLKNDGNGNQPALPPDARNVRG